MTILAKDIMSQTSIAAYRLFCFTLPYGGSRGWGVGGVRCPFKHSSLLGHYSQNYSIPSGSPLPLPFTISTPDSLLTLPPIYYPQPHVPLYCPVPVLLPLDSPPHFFTPNPHPFATPAPL